MMCFRLPDESATGGPRIGIGSAVTSAAVLNIIFAQDRIKVIENQINIVLKVTLIVSDGLNVRKWPIIAYLRRLGKLERQWSFLRGNVGMSGEEGKRRTSGFYSAPTAAARDYKSNHLPVSHLPSALLLCFLLVLHPLLHFLPASIAPTILQLSQSQQLAMPSQVATCLRMARQFSADPAKVRLDLLPIATSEETDAVVYPYSTSASLLAPSPAVFAAPRSTRSSPPPRRPPRT